MIWNPAPSFGELTDGSEGAFAPAVDIFEDDDAVLVNVELAGVRAEDVVVDAADRVLTIRGERRQEPSTPREGYHRRERTYGPFTRSFCLPETIDSGAAVAVMVDGVLTIRLPKRELPASSTSVRRAS